VGRLARVSRAEDALQFVCGEEALGRWHKSCSALPKESCANRGSGAKAFSVTKK